MPFNLKVPFFSELFDRHHICDRHFRLSAMQGLGILCGLTIFSIGWGIGSLQDQWIESRHQNDHEIVQELPRNTMIAVGDTIMYCHYESETDRVCYTP